ncbi:MAG: threonine synthase [Actinobacteria bacterium]|nr:threonine synthase [Actinomycetota bacterium]
MGYVKNLRCRECRREYPKDALFVCEYCFGPLEVTYDYDRIKKVLTREAIESKPKNLWRYRELLPIDGDPTDGLYSGFTPLIRAKNLEKKFGVRELYVKDDSVCHPTLSFKDRVVAVALSKAKEFGFNTVACASTGNLANSVAANAAIAGLGSYIFIPADLETGKVIGTLIYGSNVVAVKGNYDDVNRLCAEIASKYSWAFVNINLRPYYAEGSKTYGFEIVEQMGWCTPDHVIVPCAGGSLITKISKAFLELHEIGLIEKPKTKIHAAQALGCSPIVTAIKEKSELIKPVKPMTIAKSLAIGNPADGYFARETVERTGGWGEVATDSEIIDGIKLLAETEGIFTETAGGVTVSVTKKLLDKGYIDKDSSVVISITGNGLKTYEAINGRAGVPIVIEPNVKSFEEKAKIREH